MKFVGEEFLLAEFGNVFACGATTSSLMDKRRPQLDSACQIGPGSTPHEFLTVVVMVLRGGEVCWMEFFVGGVFSVLLSVTTMSLGNKWRSPFDSACSKGVEHNLPKLLIVAGDGDGGGVSLLG